MDIEGKVVVVTGAGAGIGAALAEAAPAEIHAQSLLLTKMVKMRPK